MAKLGWEFLDTLQREMQDHLFFFRKIIEEFGELKATKSEEYRQEDHLHDFYFYCLTKAARSTDAMDVLLTKGFPEDAMTVARTIYECYLHLAYIQRHEERIDDFVGFKIWAYGDLSVHPKTKRGRPIYQKVIDPASQEERELGASLIEMASNTAEAEDKAIHNGFYSLLSEFAHLHFIAAGSYWSKDEASYDFSEVSKNTWQSIIWGLYCTWLIVESLTSFRLIDEDYRLAANELSKESSILLLDALERINFDKGISGLKEKLVRRLGGCLN